MFANMPRIELARDLNNPLLYFMLDNLRIIVTFRHCAKWLGAKPKRISRGQNDNHNYQCPSVNA